MCTILWTLAANLILQTAAIENATAGNAQKELKVKVLLERAIKQIDGLEVDVVSERVLDYDKAEVEIEGEYKIKGQALVWDGEMLVAADSKMRTFKKKFILMSPQVRAPAAVETNGIADVAVIDWKGDVNRESIAFKPIFEDIVPKGLQDKWWHRTQFELQGGVNLLIPGGTGDLAKLHGAGLTMMTTYRAKVSSYLFSFSGLEKSSLLHHLKFSGSYTYTRTAYSDQAKTWTYTLTPTWITVRATQEFKNVFLLSAFYPTLTVGWESFDRNSPNDGGLVLRRIGPHYSYKSIYAGTGILFGVIDKLSADFKFNYSLLTTFKDVQKDASGIVARNASLMRAELGLTLPMFGAKERGYGFYLTGQAEWSRLGVGYSNGDKVIDMNNLGVLGVSYRLK